MAQNVAGTLVNVNDSISIQTNFVGSVTINLQGASSNQNVVFETTSDGTTWSAVAVYPMALTTGYTMPLPTAQANGDYRYFISSVAQFRVRLLAGTNVAVTLVPLGGSAAGQIITQPTAGTTLQSLADVSVIDGQTIDQRFLMWSQASNRWIAKDITEGLVVATGPVGPEGPKGDPGPQGNPGTNANTYIIAGSFEGTLLANEILLTHVVVLAVTQAAGLVDSKAVSTVAATAQTVLAINQNGTQIGTITFAAGSKVGVVTSPSAVNLNPGDVVTIVAPATPDATLANVAVSIMGGLD